MVSGDGHAGGEDGHLDRGFTGSAGPTGSLESASAASAAGSAGSLEPLGPVPFLDPADATAAAAAATFEPARLTLARERNGLTRTSLAGRIGATPAAVTRFERGQARPSAGTLERAAAALGLPVTYFAAGRPLVRPGDAHFRSLRSTRRYERDQARAAMSHLAELVRVIEQVVRLPRLRLPSVSPTPEEAASQVRQAWGLPDGPVHHLVRLMEANGIVISMTGFGASDRVDAFSCHPHGLSRPLVCLARERGNVLRRRFSAAHELGHLVLHPRAVPGSAAHEQEADRFAAEFLGPATQLGDVLPARLDLAYLLDVQRSWGLSVQSLLRRSRDLRVIDERTYRTGMVTLTRLGWRRTEPIAAHRPLDAAPGRQAGGRPDSTPEDGRGDGFRFIGEWPSLLREAVSLASPHGLTEESLAAGLHLPMTELRELLSHVADARPRLRLVPDHPGRDGSRG